MSDEPNEQTALVPVREAQVEFYGDTLVAAQLADGTILVPVKPLCDYLGLSWSGQFERLKQNPVLSEALQFIRVTRMNPAGGDPNVLSLPLKFLPGWLFGIQASRVKPALRERILRYQRECYDVLWNAFKGDVVPIAPPTALPDTRTPAQRSLELAEAVYHLARVQVEQEQLVYDLVAHADRTDERLAALELRLGGAGTITEGQAADLAGAVKALAAALEAEGFPNGYQKVYSELYRRFRITSYKALPTNQYAAALAWLSTWYDEVTQPIKES